MSNQKRIFLIASILFFVIIALVAYDINRRTTFPGSKPQLKERIEKQFGTKEVEENDEEQKIENDSAIHRQ